MQEKVISIIGEVILSLPFLIFTIPTGTTTAYTMSILLIIIFRRIYKYDFHFDNNNQHWCLICSYSIIIISTSLFYSFQNYFITIVFTGATSLACSKIGYLYLNYLKLKEITPYYNMLKAKYEKVDFKKMTTEEIYETCRLNNISVKVANRFVDHYINGMTYEKIADKECTSLEAIRNCFNRARKTMKI